MVCDSRALNNITIPDSNSLLLIEEALDQVAGASIFSQIDLTGFNACSTKGHSEDRNSYSLWII